MTETVVQTNHLHDWLTYRYCVSEIPVWIQCAINHILSEPKFTPQFRCTRTYGEKWLTSNSRSHRVWQGLFSAGPGPAHNSQSLVARRHQMMHLKQSWLRKSANCVTLSANDDAFLASALQAFWGPLQRCLTCETWCSGLGNVMLVGPGSAQAGCCMSRCWVRCARTVAIFCAQHEAAHEGCINSS